VSFNIFGEPVIPVQITYTTNSKLRIVGVFLITELKNNAYENANNLSYVSNFTCLNPLLVTVSRQSTYNVKMRGVPATIVAVKKQYVLYILSVTFVALGIQHAMIMHHIVICGLPVSTIFFHIISLTL